MTWRCSANQPLHIAGQGPTRKHDGAHVLITRVRASRMSNILLHSDSAAHRVTHTKRRARCRKRTRSASGVLACGGAAGVAIANNDSQLITATTCIDATWMRCVAATRCTSLRSDLIQVLGSNRPAYVRRSTSKCEGWIGRRSVVARPLAQQTHWPRQRLTRQVTAMPVTGFGCQPATTSSATAQR